jgi:hypothetical protein
MDLFPSSDEWEVQWLRIILSNRPQQSRRLSSAHLKTERDPVSETLCTLEQWFQPWIRAPPGLREDILGGT